MSADDRLTPKEIKAWCEKLIDKSECPSTMLWYNGQIIELMYKAYKRGYQDALSG